MIKAEEHSFISSYQTLTTDKSRGSYQSPKKLVKKLALMSANSCYPVNFLNFFLEIGSMPCTQSDILTDYQTQFFAKMHKQNWLRF